MEKVICQKKKGIVFHKRHSFLGMEVAWLVLEGLLQV